jgi:hypothetical protein
MRATRWQAAASETALFDCRIQRENNEARHLARNKMVDFQRAISNKHENTKK